MIPVKPQNWPDWLVQLLGLDPERIPADSEAFISLERFPEGGLGLLTLVGLGLGALWILSIYRREGTVARHKKLLLSSLRLMTFALVALVLFYPALELSVKRDQRATTIVLIDSSLSFGIKDSFKGLTEIQSKLSQETGIELNKIPEHSRSQIVEALMKRSNTEFLAQLEEKNQLEIFSFNSHIEPMAWTPKKTPEEKVDTESNSSSPETETEKKKVRPVYQTVTPVGTSTDLGNALRQAVEAQQNRPIAAIVLITDGRSTSGEDPLTVAEYLAGLGIPVHTVGIGDPSPIKNLRVQGLFAPERVFNGDPIAIDVRIDHQGFQNEAVEVILKAVPTDGDPETATVLDRSEVTLGESREATVRFETKLKKTDSYRLIAQIQVREDEAFSDDNESFKFIDVVDQATKALIIAGGPTNEYRILKNLLRRDKRVDLSAWLLSADPDAPQVANTVLKKLPHTPKEFFEFDVILLIDVNPDHLPQEFPKNLETFVSKHRGGLVYIAGEKNTAPWMSSPLYEAFHNLLPVEADKNQADAEYASGEFYTQIWPWVPTSQAVSHPATRLSTRLERNLELWSELPGFYWSFPALKAKPAATTLIRHADPNLRNGDDFRPVLVYQYYGGGRTVYLGSDETWRWRSIREEIYDQFWLQMLRALTEGRLHGDRKKLILTDKEQYSLGDLVRLSALVQDEEYQPSTADEVEISIIHPNEDTETVILSKDESQSGWFQGSFRPRQLGAYQFEMPESPKKVVEVQTPDIEFEDTRLESSVLIELAQKTQGSVVLPTSIGEFKKLPDLIPDKRRQIVITDDPQPLWDNSLVLGLLVLLLTLEWVGRKWCRLN